MIQPLTQQEHIEVGQALNLANEFMCMKLGKLDTYPITYTDDPAKTEQEWAKFTAEFETIAQRYFGSIQVVKAKVSQSKAHAQDMAAKVYTQPPLADI
jgi:hypothetical protein